MCVCVWLCLGFRASGHSRRVVLCVECLAWLFEKCFTPDSVAGNCMMQFEICMGGDYNGGCELCMLSL